MMGAAVVRAVLLARQAEYAEGNGRSERLCDRIRGARAPNQFWDGPRKHWPNESSRKRKTLPGPWLTCEPGSNITRASGLLVRV